MRYLFFCLGSLVLFWPALAESGSSALNDDVLGLIVFKADIVDPFSKLASWNEDEDSPCGWPGVKCSPKSNRVTELSLVGYSLSGRIGRGLLRLDSLQKLYLSRNNFSGGLYPKLTLIQSLRVVDLSENNLSGPIPAELFGQCRSLRSLSLSNNAFSGEIPSSISSCSTLAALNLSSNRLSGSVPRGLWSLYGLRSLDLSSNSLVGELPAGISRLYNLRSIRLNGNQLSGRLPDDIGGCFLLKYLDVSLNLLTGSFPDSIRQLSMCNFLNLGSNLFSGEVPTWIGEMKNLEFLDLSSNWFSGRIPEAIGKLQLLKTLNLSGNRFTGGLPKSISACKSLMNLDLGANSLTGNLPSWVFQLELQRFSVSGNRMSGTISIEVPTSNGQSLSYVDLSGNAFSDGVPLALGSFLGLKFLNLSRNSLSGNIPASILALDTVEVLDLSMNKFKGSIPLEVGKAISLKELWLDKNSLTGKIPVSVGNCSSLSILILSQNNLTGSIPPSLANLTNLQVVDVSFNRLSGNLPKQLSNLPHLHSFNISHNLLSGDLPAGNFFNTIPPSSLSDNPGLCGSAVNRSCRTVLPKPIVLNPNSSSSSSNPVLSSNNDPHKKIIFSISALIAIGAAIVIALGVITITVLNMRVRSSPGSQSAAALALSDGYYSNSPASDANSGKLVMFSGNHPDFSSGAHAILNKDCELGRGGFGTVYKTVLQDGKPVVIKKLTVSSLVKSQEDFEKEVKKLGKLRHPNLVALEGYYWTQSLQLLLYEFVSCGSLYKHLHECSTTNPLSWQERFDIILGIARSLAYLHRVNIIHYNLKSSNILIDQSGKAKVGDYGLAKLLPMLDRYVLSSKIQSALGYMAPEFACRTVKITEKCDVYGFGVLLLEIITGKRPVEYMEDDVVVLSDVVRVALEEGRVDELVDVRLGGKFPAEEAVPVVKLGLICTSQVPSNRPGMNEVIHILEMIRCPQEHPEE